MKLVFMSNYLNHYQLALAQNFIKTLGNDYRFIAMTPFNKERISSGWHDMNSLPFVIRAYESNEAMKEALDAAEHAEYLIIGGTPMDNELVNRRAMRSKITFEYTERIYKTFRPRNLLGILRTRFSPEAGRVQKRRLFGNSRYAYLLCAGAFVPGDFRLLGLYGGRAYKWGYFPEVKRYDDIESLISRKHKASILWGGRLIDWKHPELALMLARNLKAMGLEFSIKIIGAGEMQDTLSGMIEAMNLQDCAELAGVLPPEQVREEMEKSQIFLFTSDRNEGWGCVLNEAMNSGCACIAGEHIGAVPYLIRHGQNGLVFKDRDISDLTEKVSGLLKNPAKISELGLNAYRTMTGEWSPETAAERFLRLADALQSGKPADIFAEGPCSPASVIPQNWFRKEKN